MLPSQDMADSTRSGDESKRVATETQIKIKRALLQSSADDIAAQNIEFSSPAVKLNYQQSTGSLNNRF